MKTSNKWLLAALLLLLASLTAYNMGLRTEYLRGTYKDSLRNYTTLNFRNFTAIDLPAASLMSVKVTAGPYAVRINKAAEKYLKVSEKGGRLTIAVVFPEGRQYLGQGDVVTISCPRLRLLTASSTFTQAGKPAFDRENDRGNTIQIQGFRQDSLLLSQDKATQIELRDNRLAFLEADAGRSVGSHATLRIAASNGIGGANLSVQHQSELQLESRIMSPRYQFGDSARVTFAGAALSGLPR